MAEIKLQKRVVYAGDVHIALLKDGRKVTLKVAINGGQAPQREDV